MYVKTRRPQRVRARFMVGAILCITALVAPTAAHAVPPSNDNLSSAAVVASLPFHDTLDISEATIEPGEPFYCTGSSRSVWYRVTTPSAGLLRFDLSRSAFFDVTLRVFREVGPGFGGLSLLACASPYWNGERSLTLNVQAGSTYVVQAGSVFSSGGTLGVDIVPILPPANDHFADAQAIDALPFSHAVDTTGATSEPGEPVINCPTVSDRTVWYAYAPTETQSVTASMAGPFAWGIAAYTGSTVSSLTRVACTFSSVLTIRAEAGSTYWFQVARSSGGSEGRFALNGAPAPVPQIAWFPSDPSINDSVQFFDHTSDPAAVGVASREWDFGDGATSTLANPAHRYAADGDYVVRLTVTTHDGRTASLTRAIHIETHDIVITRINAPQSAAAGQTRSLNVGVENAYYDETVEVELLRSNGASWARVGLLTQFVPVRNGNRTTSFVFSYTFTDADASAGSVSFRAVARIIGRRDSAPLNNDVTALPTSVH